jgi:hypothetical protein
MVTVRQERGLRFFFYSNEHDPAHVHVERDGLEAKINLIGADGAPELVSMDPKFRRPDVRLAMKIVTVNRDKFLERWIKIHG